MHIPDGILPGAVAAAGYATTGATTYYTLRKIDQRDNPRAGIPKAALLTTAFFVASWIHIPVPPVSVHLVLNGLMGAVLGYYAFPAILIGLFFQAVMFQHGGLSTLGVNATMLGVPALVAYLVFRLRRRIRDGDRTSTAVFGFLAGAVGLGLGAAIALTLLVTNIPAELDAGLERNSLLALGAAHVPLMLLEGTFTALVVTYLLRVKPELLED